MAAKTRSDYVVDDGSNNCSSNSSSSSMYMLVSLEDHKSGRTPDRPYDRAGVVLYRIDPLYHLHHDNSCDLNDLRPLLVFPSTCIRMRVEYFSCVKFGSKLYFFGLDHYIDSFGIYEESTDVYTIEEKVLLGIKPSEHNDVNNFKQLFTKTKNPMHGPKYVPAIFVANQKLYVMSQYNTNTIFEVFSPVDETWQVLPTPYHEALGEGVSLFLEQNQTFYFVSGDTFLSFNLETHEWTVPPGYISDDYPDIDEACSYPRPPSTHLDKCVSLVGDMAFGYVHDDAANSYYVSASQTFSLGEELVKPYFAPDEAFLKVLRSSRFTYMSGHHDLYSDYIVGLQDLDGKQVLCIVTYGTKLPDGKGSKVYTKTGYVALSFFDIPGDSYISEYSPIEEFDVHAYYADEKKAEDGGVVRRYFNAKFRRTAHFIIDNSHLCTRGHLEACFF